MEIPFAFLHTLLKLLTIFDDTALNHLAEKVVALTGALADAGEHREAVVTLRDIIDKLHDEHCLAYTGTSEETDFTTL